MSRPISTYRTHVPTHNTLRGTTSRLAHGSSGPIKPHGDAGPPQNPQLLTSNRAPTHGTSGPITTHGGPRPNSQSLRIHSFAQGPVSRGPSGPIEGTQVPTHKNPRLDHRPHSCVALRCLS
ncbi:hypothetical protein HAZT_HAZT004293 [Hyalella azteca]|uniref:Uncharacterized protein n=1 Tax=Hyalella azteca TaxID=294128 RepID=A0A6A0H1Z6_HYAAZ|nr:hypothetical protein HAZT_HAZT004293 [Hyalella azteca]